MKWFYSLYIPCYLNCQRIIFTTLKTRRISIWFDYFVHWVWYKGHYLDSELFNILLSFWYRLMRMSLGTTVRLLPCDLEGIGSNPRNSLFACESMAVFVYPPQTPFGGSFLHWVSFWCLLVHSNEYNLKVCITWIFRFVLFVSKFMVRVHNVASVLLISMPCVLQGPVIEWRWEFTQIKLACLISCDLKISFNFKQV